MTVTYTREVATCRWLGCFLKLLLRWRASIYKLVWLDLALFLTIYYSLSLLYRMILDVESKKTFEKVVDYCQEHSSQIPLSFVLGFYVTIVMTRWWNQYTAIPWPDSIAVFVSATIHGNDERGRVMRRTIMRYICFCLTLVLSDVSPRVKKRFPTLDHFVEAGLLLENELHIIDTLHKKSPKLSKHWLPIVWAASIVTRARKEGRIRDDFAVKTLIDELNKFRGNCGNLITYDTISIPLVYTQVVTIATYTYFITNVMGRQWVESKATANIDLYFPVFTTLEFFFYMGWLKVAETLINPFGEDDDDFEVNWIIDRNLQVGYLIVDEMHHEHPELIKDQYWDEVFPKELPHTAASEPFRGEHPEPSTANIQLSAAQQEIAPSSVRIEDMAPEYGNKFRPDLADDAMSGIHFSVGGKLSRSASRVSNRERTISESSVASNHGGSLSRINSAANVLKKLFSKEDRIDGSKTPGKMAKSASQISLQKPTPGYNETQLGSMRIGVIEEVDEQMTLTSMRNNDPRPHVQSIFPQGPPPPSAPVNVPKTKSPRQFSVSAPVQDVFIPSGSLGLSNIVRNDSNVFGSKFGVSETAINFADNDDDNESLGNRSLRRGSSDSNLDDDDEFTKLKVEREKQRMEKAIEKIARSVSMTRRISGNDPETINLVELLDETTKLDQPEDNE